MVDMQDEVEPAFPAETVAPGAIRQTTGVPYGQVISQAPTWLAPQLSTPQLLRPPEPELARALEARVQRGYAPEGFDSPRGKLWVSGVLPSSACTVIAAITAVATGGVTEAVFTALTTTFAATAVGLVAFIRRDPLRLRTAQRRRLNENRTWHSRQPWHHVPADCEPRLLISRAQQAVGTIVTSPAWNSAEFDDHRARLDLVAELDEIDAQAFTLARVSPSPSELTALTARVDALSAYATAISSHPVVPAVNPQAITTAVVGGVLDEYATDHLRALTEDVRER